MFDCNWEIIVATAVAVTLAWVRWGTGTEQVYLAKKLVQCNVISHPWALLLEFSVVLILNATIAIIFVDPQTSRQAFAAGLASASVAVKLREGA